ncbi:MAG: DUF4258 domain-containing protein [Acidobacteriota bacterium]
MFERILSEIQEAASAKRVYLTEHARDEMADDGLMFTDVIHCILTGEIVEQQYDVSRNENKYVIYGDCLNEDEMALVAKLTYNRNVGVITVYRLRFTDYD